MADRLTAELTPLCQNCTPVAVELLRQTEGRFRRLIEAFRDRLSRNIVEALGVTVSSAAWEVKRPQVAVVPVAVSRTFMTDWGLLWWLLPMWLVGGLFRRHVLGRIPWEVEKILTRLTGDWAASVQGNHDGMKAALEETKKTRRVAWVLVRQGRPHCRAYRPATAAATLSLQPPLQKTLP